MLLSVSKFPFPFVTIFYLFARHRVRELDCQRQRETIHPLVHPPNVPMKARPITSGSPMWVEEAQLPELPQPSSASAQVLTSRKLKLEAKARLQPWHLKRQHNHRSQPPPLHHSNGFQISYIIYNTALWSIFSWRILQGIIRDPIIHSSQNLDIYFTKLVSIFWAFYQYQQCICS